MLPEHVVICDNETDTDKLMMKEIRKECEKCNIRCYGNYVYLDSEEEVTLFLLKWS